MTTTPPVGTIPTSQIVWEAMDSMRDAGQVISRRRLQEVTGLTMSKIDDHLSKWFEEGRIRRVEQGVYEIACIMPPTRPTSVTDVDGMVIIEAGNEQMRLSPKEADAIGTRLMGNAMRYAQIQSQHDYAALLAEATVQNRSLSDRIADQNREMQSLKVLVNQLSKQQLGLTLE